MGLIGYDYPIILMASQVVDNDPDGLIEHDRKWLKELRKPKTISFKIIIKEPSV